MQLRQFRPTPLNGYQTRSWTNFFQEVEKTSTRISREKKVDQHNGSGQIRQEPYAYRLGEPMFAPSPRHYDLELRVPMGVALSNDLHVCSLGQGKPAAAAGVKVGHRIVAINGHQVRTFKEFDLHRDKAGGVATIRFMKP